MLRASPAFKAVVFDMDGLLLDSERPVRDAWMHVAAELGVPLSDADYLSLVGLNHADSRERLLVMFAHDAALLATVHQRAQTQLAAQFGDAPFDAKPGARRLLGRLQAAGLPCAVASSTAHAEVRRRLHLAGLLGYFGAVCGGDEVQRGKPQPDLYTLALARLRSSPHTSLAFEDSGHGVQAALAAGLAVVAVPDLKAPEPEWQARCIAVLESLEAVDSRSLEWFGIDNL